LELKQQGMGEFKRLLLESRKKLENLVKEIREGELTRDKTVAVKDFLSSLEKQVQDADSSLAAEEQLLRETATRLESEAAGETETREKIQKSQKIRPASAQQFAPGTEVFYGPGKQRGVLLRQAKKDIG
jgi:DNA mismatch repair protein MutS2